MAKPKLCLIPAAQGSKLYSVLPSSGVGDFDFTRSGSATRINAQGLIETVASGVSRLNYPMIDGVVKGCPHHILEPQRTNLIQYSDINTAWNLQANIINSLNTDVIAPDGTLNGWKASRNINSDGYTYMTGVGLSTNTTYTASIWLKAYDVTICDAVVFNFHPNSFTSSSTTFSFETGIASGNGKVEKYSNGWYRLSLTSISNSTIGYFDIGLQPYLNGSNNWGGQDGDTLFYAYGTQVEVGSYPTSYIKTTSAAVTRSAETANSSGDAATFNDSEGVLMVETSALTEIDSYRTICLSDSSTSDRINIWYWNNGTIKIDLYSQNNSQFEYDIDIDTTLFNKIAVKYKLNNFSIFINGFEVFTDLVGVTPIGLNEINFSHGNELYPFYGKTKQIQYFDTALNSEDLEKLTSWVSFQEMAEGQLYTIE